MIIAKLTGGLGNQMFQYAMARAVSERLKTPLKLDLSDYLSGRRKFGLDVFNIKIEKATSFEIFKTKHFPFGRKFEEKQFHYDPAVNDIKDGTYISTTLSWQNEDYFKDIENIIRKEFTLKTSIKELHPDAVQDILTSNSVSLHIRRTDYLVKEKTYNILTPEYYTKAMSMVSERVQNPKYFVFSDDIEWVKKNLEIKNQHEFVSDKGYKDYEELALMALCKHNIIANSSFSWWGAWLGNNSDKVVIAPQKWLNDEKYNTTELIPKKWLEI